MTDPFDALHLPIRPVDPDPEFAERLRARLQEAILEGDRDTMTTATESKLHTLTPYLAVRDARAALDFYVDVFGATRRGDPIVMDDGRIGHAELAIGDSVLMLAEEFPEVGHLAPDAAHPSFRLEVPDVDGTIDRALTRGAELLRPIADSGYGRGGTVLDPFGHRWMVTEAAAAQSPPESSAESPAGPKHGELGYHTFQVPDADQARAFYGAVLGWQFSPGRVENGWQIEGTGGMAGLWGGQGQIGWKLMYAVNDLDTALERVREQGGTVVSDPERQPYGLSAECKDNQGIEFWLWQQ
jgi:uncharacterized glyoxalase superfamily protein PhnB